MTPIVSRREGGDSPPRSRPETAHRLRESAPPSFVDAIANREEIPMLEPINEVTDEIPDEVVRGECVRLNKVVLPALERFERRTGIRVNSLAALRSDDAELAAFDGLEISIDSNADQGGLPEVLP